MNDLFYTPGWMRKAAEERWKRERETEIRRVEEKMQAEASFAGQWMDGSTPEQRDMLLEREDYHRKRLAERPKPAPIPEPPPIEKPKYRKPDRSAWKRKPFPGEKRRGDWWAEELLSLISKSKAFSPCDQPTYTVDDRIIEKAESWHNHWRVDARDMVWDGYEWAIV